MSIGLREERRDTINVRTGRHVHETSVENIPVGIRD
jgi:hypothetical protein